MVQEGIQCFTHILVWIECVLKQYWANDLPCTRSTLTFTLCNTAFNVMTILFTPYLHILHNDMTIKLKLNLLIITVQVYKPIMHILQWPVTKLNSCCIIWFKLMHNHYMQFPVKRQFLVPSLFMTCEDCSLTVWMSWTYSFNTFHLECLLSQMEPKIPHFWQGFMHMTL